MAKIAVELERAVSLRKATGGQGEARPSVIAQGDGWTVADVLCTSGPCDRPFEEQHSSYTIAIVAAGTFQYRGTAGCELMSPGSLVLGNAGDRFECGHEHAHGDRCLAFWYAPEYFERLAAGAGARKLNFPALRMPPLRELSPLTARAIATFSTYHCGRDDHGAAGNIGADSAWEEISVDLAVRAIRLAAGLPSGEVDPAPSAVARVTRTVRRIEREPHAALTLASLAREAGLSSYHFLRVFEQLTGLTPHQYIVRTRLREAAMRLASMPDKVLDIAFDCGFGDVSNFNRAFRAEFDVSPRAFRKNLPRTIA